MQRSLLLGVLLPLVVVACNGALDDRDGSATYDLRVGEVMDLSLESNPSTGFDWVVVEIDPSIVRQAGDPTFLPGGDEDVVGAPGNTVFEFEAVGEGETTIVLHYVREWEDVEPEQVHEETITVGSE